MVNRLKFLTKALIFVVWIQTQSRSLKKILICQRPNLKKIGGTSDGKWNYSRCSSVDEFFSSISKKRLRMEEHLATTFKLINTQSHISYVHQTLENKTKRKVHISWTRCHHNGWPFLYFIFLTKFREKLSGLQSGVQQERIPVVGY